MEIWSWHHIGLVKPEAPTRINPEVAAGIAQVMLAWRAAERSLEGLVEASPMRTLVRSEVARLRGEYHRLFALAMR